MGCGRIRATAGATASARPLARPHPRDRWRDADIDGFNLSRIVTPERLEDFVDPVVPILQERGTYKSGYGPGSLREKLFGHARPADTHPGAQCRRSAGIPQRSAAE